MREVLYSKLVFLDSHDGVRGTNSLKTSFHIPSHAFSCGQGESMRMVLKSFTMPKAFYNINQTNNTFFYRNTTAGTDTKIELAHGDYTGAQLATEIASRVNDAFSSGTSFTCNYSTINRRLTLSIPSTYPTGYFVCYFDKTVGRSKDNHEHYNDAYEILGGTPSTDLSAPVNMFEDGHTNGSSSIIISKYPIRLSTIENILLRCSLQGDAYASTSYDVFKTGNKLDATDIFAAIPNVVTDNGHIVLVDNNEDFQIHLKQGQLTDLKFDLSDGKGRELPLVTGEQAKDGNLNFNLCFKFEILAEPHEAHIVTEGVAQYRHPPEMTK